MMVFPSLAGMNQKTKLARQYDQRVCATDDGVPSGAAEQLQGFQVFSQVVVGDWDSQLCQ